MPTCSGSFGEVAPGVTKGTPACWKIGPSAGAESEIGEAHRYRHLVRIQELAGDGGDHGRVGLCVVDDQIYGLAVDAAGGVDLLGLELGAIQGGRIKRRQRSRHVERRPDLDAFGFCYA